MHLRLKYDRATTAMMAVWQETLSEYEVSLVKEIEAMGGLEPTQCKVLFESDRGRLRLRGICAEIEARAIPVSAEIYEGQPEVRAVSPGGHC